MKFIARVPSFNTTARFLNGSRTWSGQVDEAENNDGGFAW